MARDPAADERLRSTLRERRLELGLSQFHLARRLGGDVRQELISKIEIGERRIDVFELIAIARALDTTLVEVLDRAGIDHR
ncbi:helix-turn-helix domain-containing protein [Phytoactinopolyspora limicola]|uniref:helix-turn-helix domain-containing protein n=1 Tax=Phytoactinopolyspora limicola TaxID=2715536 RepID=UPI0014082555|nr:helix-turn-helix transcriptional regulator [Phytoactinopolyspora limicola]